MHCQSFKMKDEDLKHVQSIEVSVVLSELHQTHSMQRKIKPSAEQTTNT